ncbi:MAG: transposase family protein [Rhodospirillales bacterium]|nr:transposase family protein [Rhodospirillales bacterium]
MPSRRIHSRYSRMLGDLPWQGRPVTLRVQARRFRCLNPACSRQTFAERLVNIAPVAARRTERLGDLQRCLGLPSGAIPAATLLEPLAHLIHGKAGIRWRVSRKALILFTGLGVEAKQFPLSREPHPPCPKIPSCRSISQPSGARKSQAPSMVDA